MRQGGPAELSAPETTSVRCDIDGALLETVLMLPAKILEPVPLLLVLHEWWGLTAHIREVARRLAWEGYAAAVPALYARLGSTVTEDPAEAAKLMSALSSQAALRDLNVVIQTLKAHPAVDALRIGMIGFSMGGTIALTMATHNSDLKAAVVFYGKVPLLESLDALLCPLQYHFPAKDEWVTKAEVALLQQGLRSFGKAGEVHAYPEAGHAFFNETRPEVYRPEDAQVAWQRTLRFLRQHVQ